MRTFLRLMLTSNYCVSIPLGSFPQVKFLYVFLVQLNIIIELLNEVFYGNSKSGLPIEHFVFLTYQRKGPLHAELSGGHPFFDIERINQGDVSQIPC